MKRKKSFILSEIITDLVSKECKKNGSVCSDSKDGDAAVENHKDILVNEREPAIRQKKVVLYFFVFFVFLQCCWWEPQEHSGG